MKLPIVERIQQLRVAFVSFNGASPRRCRLGVVAAAELADYASQNLNGADIVDGRTVLNGSTYVEDDTLPPHVIVFEP